ncbi:MAG: GxGYxYP family putative glycoside hydrolase, partial [Candidatus Sumerlaeota bacterium]|nr:GxGYxYP family putative glycoside hydrolase [Candidatus Sumerlaeota bacterium]
MRPKTFTTSVAGFWLMATLAATAAEGVVNEGFDVELKTAKQPIYVVRDDADQFWLEWLQRKGYIKDYAVVDDWTALARAHADCVRGAVAPDPNLYRGNLIALNVAACEDLLVATPELAQRLGLTVKIDLTGRFPTYVEAMRWLWTQYGAKINPFLADYLAPERARKGAGTVDYSVQQRALMMWPPSDAEANRPGVDPVADLKTIADILSHMAPDGVAIGWPGGAKIDGRQGGLREVLGVDLVSLYGKGIVACGGVGNLSLLSGVRTPPLKQRPQPPAPPLERDRIYVAPVVTDGNNITLYTRYYRDHYYSNGAVTRMPMSFTISPMALDLMPAIVEWYYEQDAMNVEFIAACSGATYIRTPAYCKAYAAGAAGWANYLDWT